MKDYSNSKNKYSEDEIMKVLEFLVDNISVVFARKVFQWRVGIPIGTNCAPSSRRHLSVFIRSKVIQSLLSTGRKQHLGSISLTGTSIIYCP